MKHQSLPHLSGGCLLAACCWVMLLYLFPHWMSSPVALAITAALAGTISLVTVWVLLRKRTVLVLPNLMQPILFCLLSAQLYFAFGPEQYRFESVPQLGDWIQLTGVHSFRAIDLLDFLEAYGIDLQNLEPASIAAGTVLVAMHLVVDFFLLSVLAVALSGVVEKLRAKPASESPKPRRHWTRLLIRCRWWAVGVCVLTLLLGGIYNQWSMTVWLLWPLDNVLRVIDVGDMMQIFGWGLHAAKPDLLTSTLAVVFRLAASLVVTERLNYLRLRTGALGYDAVKLAEELRSPYRVIREQVVLTLSKLKAEAAPAIPVLLDCLHDDDEAVRHQAATLLGEMSATEAVPALISLLNDDSYMVRVRATTALGELGDESAFPVLCQFFDKQNAYDYEFTLQEKTTEHAVSALFAANPSVRSALINRLRTEDLQTRSEVVMLLARINVGSSELFQQLAETLRSQEWPTNPRGKLLATEIWKALTHTGGCAHAIQRLAELAASELMPIRLNALSTILAGANEAQWNEESGWTAATKSAVVAVCVERLNDPAAKVRLKAVESLMELEQNLQIVKPSLLKGLDDIDLEVRLAAAEALVNLGETEVAVPVLIEGLSSNSPRLIQAIITIGKAGTFAVPAVPRLLEHLLEGSLLFAGDDLVEALSEIGTAAPEVRQQFLNCLETAPPGARGEICMILAKLETDADRAVPALVNCLHDENSSKQYRAMKALANYGPQARAALPALKEKLTESDVAVVGYAASAIFRIDPDSRIVEQFRRELKSADTVTRRRAAFVIGQFPPPPPQSLRRLLTLIRDRDDIVRIHAIQSLACFPREELLRIPRLREKIRGRLHDESETVRVVTGRLLDHLELETG